MNILFTCAGRRTYLLKYFKENMDVNDLIIATDMQKSAPALQMADVKIIVPTVYAPDYIEQVFNICQTYHVNVLISLNDLELPILAGQKKKFERIGTKIIVSDPNVIDIAFDKYKTALWIESIGLIAPKTYINIEDAKKALKNAEIAFPLILKPRWGSGSIGIETVYDIEELDLVYRLLLKKIKRTILSTVSVGNEYILIQERLTGKEFGLDVMNDLKGNNIAVSVKQKLSMRAGETDKAITIDMPDIRQIGHKIGQCLKHIGNLDVDIMQRANGDHCILELNPRFGGGFPFSYEAGVNLPKAIIEWVKGNEIDPSILQPTYGLLFSKNDFLMPINI